MGFTIIFFVGIAFLIAYFLGRKRQIGFGWSLFFSVVFSPIVGFIITMLSPKYYDDNPEPSKNKRVVGWILAIFFGLSALASLMAASQDPSALGAAGVGIGLSGAGLYLIQRGKGKSFNSEELVKSEN